MLAVAGSRRESFTLKRRSGPEMTGARERAEPSSENPGSRNKIQVRYIYFRLCFEGIAFLSRPCSFFPVLNEQYLTLCVSYGIWLQVLSQSCSDPRPHMKIRVRYIRKGLTLRNKENRTNCNHVQIWYEPPASANSDEIDS